ncbi:MAG: methylated-DNA--[protein]-cysteine S-methyltransferase [Cyclobacteriaceae bacterium]|nr:methylated-DNA--[protein]-cysteine S-methyltransferase [Cyclobacteriaceae bacterium]
MLSTPSIISLSTITTPIGPMVCGSINGQLCLLEFEDRRMLPTQLKRITHFLSAQLRDEQVPFHDQVQQEITGYFEAKRKTFDLPLLVPGTKFQQAVWLELEKIPYGKTRSYLQQAKALGNEKAIRAVAKANGDNRLAIIIPCHRVIGSHGEMTGYGGKIWRKKFLLELEGAIVPQPRLF